MPSHNIVAELIRDVSPVPPLLGAEIGVLFGDRSSAFLTMFPGLVLYCVDPWAAYPAYPDFDQAHLDKAFRHFRCAVLEPFAARIRLLKMTSEAAVAHVLDGSLDFVFVDANHEYAYPRQDILIWEPKLRPGGLMCGHDYGGAQTPGVTRAVDELYGNRAQKAREYMWWLTIEIPGSVGEANESPPRSCPRTA